MANKKAKKTEAKPVKTASNVTRLKATDTAPKTKKTEVEVETVKIKATDQKAIAKVEKPKTKRTISPKSALKPLKASGSYFVGAWQELRQVHWPTRRATWGMTLAVLAYSAFFVLLVLLLDAGFKYLFDLILKK